ESITPRVRIDGGWRVRFVPAAVGKPRCNACVVGMRHSGPAKMLRPAERVVPIHTHARGWVVNDAAPGQWSVIRCRDRVCFLGQGWPVPTGYRLCPSQRICGEQCDIPDTYGIGFDDEKRHFPRGDA